MKEYYYGEKTNRVITPFGNVQFKLNNRPLHFLCKKCTEEWLGKSYTVFRLYLDLENYKVGDEIACGISGYTFAHLTSDENFSSSYIENKDYFLAIGVYDSEENGYWPPFRHCFEAYFSDVGVCVNIFDDPQKYNKKQSRYFRATVAWLAKTVEDYDDIVDMIVDSFERY